ncbi:MAG: hypothetical protein WC279_09670 [Sulfurimonas sp.]|jgi:hypothetical protein|uniref:hypothetical protein n=1 Tax=Sulfurimonas sp. TaxID=2022749 RepID=UPI003568AA96
MKKIILTSFLLALGFTGCGHNAQSLNVPTDSKKLFAKDSWQRVNNYNKVVAR